MKWENDQVLSTEHNVCSVKGFHHYNVQQTSCVTSTMITTVDGLEQASRSMHLNVRTEVWSRRGGKDVHVLKCRFTSLCKINGLLWKTPDDDAVVSLYSS